ncbi:MAG: hypothetical protein IPK24_10945 [Kineosporiaceae bacterium]|nr:hypothetical protein [Kineosporiaceae bacterium]
MTRDLVDPCRPHRHPAGQAGVRPRLRGVAGRHVRGRQQHPGFVGAQIIPPAEVSGEYQVVLQFESEAGIDSWNRSAERAQ